MRLLNIGELRGDAIGALTFGAEIPPYKDGALPSAPPLRYAFPTAPTWQVRGGAGCAVLLSAALLRAMHAAFYTTAKGHSFKCWSLH